MSDAAVLMQKVIVKKIRPKDKFSFPLKAR
jgi:hypothetical protein